MKNILLIGTLLTMYCHAMAQKNITLTAMYEKDKKVVLLQWQHVHKNAISYTLQSSKDNSFFTDIFTKQSNGISVGSILKYADKTITGEKIYYRLLINQNDVLFETTVSIMVTLNIAENTWLLYPLPAKEYVNLKYTGTGTVDGVISIFIQRLSSGVIFNRLRLASNTKNIHIPITNLGSGVYVMHVSIGNRAPWNQQFIKY
jgi:hypothetical protein